MIVKGSMPSPTLDTRVRDLVVVHGDLRAAATDAIRDLGPEVLQYLRSLLHDEDTAADAFSRFCESLWRGLSTFRWSASLRTWAFRIATNAAIDIERERRHRRARRLATSEASKIAADVLTSTVVRVERRRRALEKLREGLSMEERTLLALRIDRELSWAEISDVLSADGKQVDVAALKKRFERLKERLAKIARAKGVVH